MQKFALLFVVFFSLNTFASADTSSFKKAYQNYLQAVEQQDPKATLEHAEASYQLGKPLFDKHSENMVNLHYNLAAAYKDVGELENAVMALEPLLTSMDYTPDMRLDRLSVLIAQLEILNLRNFYDQSRKEYRLIREKTSLAKKISESISNDQPDNAAGVYFELAMIMTKPGIYKTDKGDANKIIRKANDLVLDRFGEEDARYLKLQFKLGDIEFANRQYDEAAQNYEVVVKQSETLLNTSNILELGARARLVEVYERLGESESATTHCVAIGKMTPWQDDIEQTPLYRVGPKYPPGSAKRLREGYVRMRYKLDKFGFVKSAEVIKATADNAMRKEAIRALKQWRFAPKVVDGEAVDTGDLYVQIDFKIAS